MSSPSWQSTVVPARLSFLAIYNPSLGPTDETFADQLVFYYSRQYHEERLAAKKAGRVDAAGGDGMREEENEQLRQIGLAQGMVDFARSFSNGVAVDSVDTEKSRIVLHELEPGWWILASIDLTRLPTAASPSSDSGKKSADKSDAGPSIEYSSREVSPPALLLQQLFQAYHVFMLHHGQSITDLFIRVSKDKFCSTLERFWTRFCRHWDVLLHGNPAADIFNGIKLSSGGELGMGVGEEEWGSGERDVLEDIARRTEGLVDLVVSRFGEPAPPKGETSFNESELLPWMGSGNYPTASDGVIFGGINAITRPSLRSIALWMEHIYAYGEHAYGVRDNPLRERRKRKRRQLQKPELTVSSNDADILQRPAPDVDARDYGLIANKRQTSDESSRKSQRDGASKTSSVQQHHHPGIPPPIVSAAEQSLATASKKADSNAGQSQEEASGSTTMGIPDQYMKYLTFGLSTFGKTSKAERPEMPARASNSSSRTMTAKRYATSKTPSLEEEDEVDPMLTHMEPIPDGETLEAKIAKQKRGEERGQFLVGMRGELDNIDADSEASEEGDEDDDSNGLRNVLRTLSVELIESPQLEENQTDLQRKLSEAGLSRGRDDPANFRRVRVLVYVHRPFMYCFLFENQTSALSMTSFYQEMHRNLLPIHKSLLSSTNATRVAERIQDAQTSDSASIASSRQSAEPTPIYDLIYDPVSLTVHTSVPNIPEPGTPAAEGIISGAKGSGINHPSLWTRIDSLNVHSQILNSISSVKRNPNEYERTSKTSRGWWVVWMKLPPASQDTAKQGDGASLAHIDSDETIAQTESTTPSSAFTWPRKPPKIETNRVAILVRKASDSVPAAPKNSSRAMSSMWNSLSLRSNYTADAITGGASAGWGPQALAGGIGIDARKYVDGLLSLGR